MRLAQGACLCLFLLTPALTAGVPAQTLEGRDLDEIKCSVGFEQRDVPDKNWKAIAGFCLRGAAANVRFARERAGGEHFVARLDEAKCLVYLAYAHSRLGAAGDAAAELKLGKQILRNVRAGGPALYRSEAAHMLALVDRMTHP